MNKLFIWVDGLFDLYSFMKIHKTKQKIYKHTCPNIHKKKLKTETKDKHQTNKANVEHQKHKLQNETNENKL